MEESIVNQKVNIYSLKSLLRSVISVYEEKKQIKENNKYLMDIYKELIELINNVDINAIEENSLSISLLLPIIYNNEEALRIENKIDIYIYQLSKMKDNKDLEDEYNKISQKLNRIISKIIKEYEVICNKNELYTREVQELDSKAYICRGILYKLNTKNLINDYQKEEIKKLLQENNWSEEQSIIIQEYIRNHNIKCKFEKPKTSYTTIKMLEYNYDLYETDNLIDKDTKNKLNESVNSMFEIILTENDLNIPMFIEEMTSWMSREYYEYTIKSIMNKFLNVLNECKNNMVNDNNYEDLEVRKIIIEEFNSYYYKFLTLQRYYEHKLNDKEIIEEIPEEEINEVGKHLFFAKTNDIAYVEKDIEYIPNEYYQRVKKLIEGFKFDLLSGQNIERFSSNGRLKGYFKLKEDQVRIVIRSIFNDNYLILGIMLKKSDRATKDYVNIIKRDYEYDISNEELYNKKYLESEEIYTNLIEYLDSNSRKGNR